LHALTQLFTEELTHRTIPITEKQKVAVDIAVETPAVKLRPVAKHVPIPKTNQQESIEAARNAPSTVQGKMSPIIVKPELPTIESSIKSEESHTSLEEGPLDPIKELFLAEAAVQVPEEFHETPEEEVLEIISQSSTSEQIVPEIQLEMLVLREMDDFVAAMQAELEPVEPIMAPVLSELLKDPVENSEVVATVTEIIEAAHEIRLMYEADTLIPEELGQSTEKLRILCKELLLQLDITPTPKNISKLVQRFIKVAVEISETYRGDGIKYMEEGTHEQKFSDTSKKHFLGLTEYGSDTTALIGRFALRIRPFVFSHVTS
jgi:hypothetical protein